jgi:hypothetical protein
MSAARPIIEFAGRKIAVDVPHLVFATSIAGWCAWFCRDAWRSNSGVENLILIVPAAAVAVILYLFVAAGCFRAEPGGATTAPSSRGSVGSGRQEGASSEREPLAGGIGIKVAGSMALLAGFVVTGPLIGFDIASFLYMLGMLFFLGERRIVVLLAVPVIFCAAAIYCFNNLLSTPLPLYFFSGNT